MYNFKYYSFNVDKYKNTDKILMGLTFRTISHVYLHKNYDTLSIMCSLRHKYIFISVDVILGNNKIDYKAKYFTYRNYYGIEYLTYDHNDFKD